MRTNYSKLLIIAVTLFMLSCVSIGSNKTRVAPQYVLEANNSFETIWNLSDISVMPNHRRSNMVGVPGKIVILSYKASGREKGQVIGLDSLTGKIVWTVNGGNLGEIISNGENVYSGTYGTATVRSYNTENGKLLWQTFLLDAHSITNIYSAENKIFVHTNDAEFYVLSDQGKILDSFSEILDTFLAVDGVLYMDDVYAIKAVDFSSKEQLWRLDLGAWYVPIFDNGTIFLKTWDTSTTIYAIDQVTGEVNWKAAQDVLSNLYVTEDKIYFLTTDSHLVVLNKHTGDELANLQFSPSFNLSNQSGSYFVSGDPANNILVVYFGDNSQMLGIKVLYP